MYIYFIKYFFFLLLRSVQKYSRGHRIPVERVPEEIHELVPVELLPQRGRRANSLRKPNHLDRENAMELELELKEGPIAELVTTLWPLVRRMW